MKKICSILMVLSFLMVTSCKKDYPSVNEAKRAIILKLMYNNGGLPENIPQREKDFLLNEAYKRFKVYKFICHKNDNDNYRCVIKSSFIQSYPEMFGLEFHRDKNGNLELKSMVGLGEGD